MLSSMVSNGLGTPQSKLSDKDIVNVEKVSIDLPSNFQVGAADVDIAITSSATPPSYSTYQLSL